MGLKGIIAEIENDIGLFSSQYKTIEHGHTYTIPFDRKPAEQVLASLGIPQAPETLLSTATSVLKTSGNEAIKVKGFTANTEDKELTITGQRLDRLLKSGKIYVNTALFPAGLYQRAMQEGLAAKKTEDLPPENNGVHWENLAVGVCHAQEVDLLVDTFMSRHKRAHTTVREGKIVEENPALLLLSSPLLNLRGELGGHMDRGMQSRFIEGMFFNLFDAAQREGRQYIAMTAAGLGSHGGKSEIYFKALMKVAKAFPKLNIIYHPGDHEKSFKRTLKEDKLENVVMATKNIIFIADRLNNKGLPCALHISTDSDVIYGLSDVGGHWKSNHSETHHLLSSNKKNETSQTFVGALSTAPLNSFGINPQAYASVIERNLENPLDTILERDGPSTNPIKATHKEQPLPNSDLRDAPDSNKKSIENKEKTTDEMISGEGYADEPEISHPEERFPVSKVTSVISPIVVKEQEPSELREVNNLSSSGSVIPEQSLQQTTVLPMRELSDTTRLSSSPGRNGIFSPPSNSVQSTRQPEPMSSSFIDSQLQQINRVIDHLTREIDSCWPYPNKDLKQIKVVALKELITNSETMAASDAITAVKRKYPRVTEGTLSTRTADLLVQLEQNVRVSSLELH